MTKEVEEGDSVLLKHFGRMFVWGAEDWYNNHGGPEEHIKAGREFIAQGEYYALRQVADYHNQLTKEIKDAND